MTNDLHRTNINLYSADVEWLRRTYGFGWSERVREAVASWVRDKRRLNALDTHRQQIIKDREL